MKSISILPVTTGDKATSHWHLAKPSIDNCLTIPQTSSLYKDQHVSLTDNLGYSVIEKICTLTSYVVSG